jgi:hypothetical protein
VLSVHTRIVEVHLSLRGKSEERKVRVLNKTSGTMIMVPTVCLKQIIVNF